MLTSVACLCARNGRKVSAPVVCFFSTSQNSTGTLNLTGARDVSRHRSSGLVLTPTPWQLLSARTVSLSASSHAGADPLGSPSAPAEKDPPDREHFGSFSTDMSSRRTYKKISPYVQDLRYREGDEEDGDEDRVKSRKRTNTPYWYFLQCRRLIKENKLQEALDLFSRDMLQAEGLQPDQSNFTVLIGGCGRAGELKKAFRLYNDMKKRGLEPNDATYTALFNACAESPSKQAGLRQAVALEQELRRANYPLCTITYHALLKTHAVTNHLQACIHTLREMLQNGHAVTQKTFHYLLMGCLKDKDTGFRLALQVWRQMLRSGIVPDSQNYTLLLRTARDCGIGDPAVASGVLLRPDRPLQRERNAVLDLDLLEKQLFIQPEPRADGQQRGTGGEEASDGKDSAHLVPVRQIDAVLLPVDAAGDSAAPNLLDLFEGKRVDVVSLGAAAGASDRLALIGGAEGFLEKLAAGQMCPDLRTVTLLADTMEPGRQSLQTLLKVAKQHKVKLDAAFFNTVIRRAARAGDLEEAKFVLTVMRQRHVKVDVKTFGSLALGCEQQQDGLQLLEDMEEAGLRPTVQVFSALIGRATRRVDFVYLKTMLKKMSSMKVWPNEVIIRQLEFASQYPPNYDKFKTRNNYLVQIDGFRGYYQQWLKEMPAQGAEDDQAEQPSETEGRKPGAADGSTMAQKNQRAAARRLKPHSKEKKRSAPPL
ncbi:Pentatricopeptide repeat-containing protein 1, mitochondrial [Liparis tanakae]|uniref:Pentatricopeptide repeat-containing protein 1, mitochondrial n=1 Tax=Liparis tanakae TaxID=230148 RepID=A0A4Z2ID99_9TELE|nr:Pentatricopeptide repeat-containing protein 1, mitochondrial [Liparis tanakae]